MRETVPHVFSFHVKPFLFIFVPHVFLFDGAIQVIVDENTFFYMKLLRSYIEKNNSQSNSNFIAEKILRCYVI